MRRKDRGAFTAAELGASWKAHQTRRTKTTWATVRGPISAAHLTLERLHWTWPSPFQLEDDRGVMYNLAEVSPAAMGLALRASAQWLLGNQLAADIHVEKGLAV